MLGVLIMLVIEEVGVFGLRMLEIESIGWDLVFGGLVLVIVMLY